MAKATVQKERVDLVVLAVHVLAWVATNATACVDLVALAGNLCVARAATSNSAHSTTLVAVGMMRRLARVGQCFGDLAPTSAIRATHVRGSEAVKTTRRRHGVFKEAQHHLYYINKFMYGVPLGLVEITPP